MNYTKNEFNDGTSMWSFENGVHVYSKFIYGPIYSKQPNAFEIYKNGIFLGGIYPFSNYDKCVKDLDNGNEPITSNWEDGQSHHCSFDGWGERLYKYGNEGIPTWLGWKNILDEFIKNKQSHIEEIKEIFNKAVYLAYKYHEKYNIVLNSNGKLKTLRKSHQDTDTYLQIYSIDNSNANPIEDYYGDLNDYEMLKIYEDNMSEIERKDFNKVISEFECDGVWDRLEWIYDNCEDAVKSVWEYAVHKLCLEIDIDRIFNNVLGDVIDKLEETHNKYS